ncbi:MAG: bifunctional phosphoribosylaminoimidazolecarboxamide formyltransferase/IMP cyclohydrolase [Patescibacteria group bacterium]|nr:bifunctional phosphoribosylaminoimidazolecarboxamide formyltransferase/IMP cyclohydrolase [Patescibacteria group bacterium]
MIKRALISVADKEGILEFARELDKMGVEIVSSGGTANFLRGFGIPVTDVEQITDFPEMMDGRLKTLHPRIHGGILGRATSEDRSLQSLHGIPRFDLVCVDLYHLVEYANDPDRTLLEVLDKVDIGGPTMIRGAAKNYHHGVTVICSLEHRSLVIKELKEHGRVREPMRAKLATEVFALMTRYNSVIASRMADEYGENFLVIAGTNGETLRYGTNPHQITAGVHYNEEDYKILYAGKDLSYTNWEEIAWAVEMINHFDMEKACAIFKHLSPCGVALAENTSLAFKRAWSGDPLSAFGSTVAINGLVDEATVDLMEDKFFETLICFNISQEALNKLVASHGNIRIIQTNKLLFGRLQRETKMKMGICLIQEPDTFLPELTNFIQAGKKEATQKQLEELIFAATCCKFLSSNATAITRRKKMIGYGRGGASRVEVCQRAVESANNNEHGLNQSVAVTDGFFPFPDGLEVLAKAGIKVIAGPNAPTAGLRRKKVIAKADELGVAFYYLDHRLFRH